jgi:3-oxoacyl-(acyl-carrier-protein) synthase
MDTMYTKKIFITQAGVLSALGMGFDSLNAGIAEGPLKAGFKNFEFHTFDIDVPCFTVRGFDPVAVLGKKGLRLKDNATKMLLGTFDCGFKSVMENPDELTRPGLAIGTSFGSVQSIGDFLSDSIVNGVNNVNPQAFANTVINSPTGNVNIRYCARNLSATVSTGFNSGLDALVYAFNYIQRGYFDAIVAGGLEEISYYSLLGLQRTGILSTSGNVLPFSARSGGIVPGEGCALFLIESEESMKAAGRKPLVEIAGIASAFDPEIAQNGNSDASTSSYVLSEACKDAGVAREEIGFIASSGSGNSVSDRAEAAALTATFSGRVPVTAYKMFTGECYGASAALNVALAVNDLKSSRISGCGERYSCYNDIPLVFSTVNTSCAYAIVHSLSCDGNCGAIVLKNIE